MLKNKGVFRLQIQVGGQDKQKGRDEIADLDELKHVRR